MIKIVIGDKSADVTAEGWQAVREGLDRYFDGILALERAIGISPSLAVQDASTPSPTHAVSRVMPSTATAPPPIPRAIPRVSTEKTIIEYALEAINHFGAWTTLEEIVNHMVESGWKTTATSRVNRNSTVRNAMRDKPNLVQSQGTLWGLSTWPVIDDYAPIEGEEDSMITLDDMFPEYVGVQHVEKNNKEQNGVENELGPNFGKIP